MRGNDFVTKSADIPEDAIELTVTAFNAMYIEPGTQYYRADTNAWVLQINIEETGYAYAWFLICTNQPYALSGVYNTTRKNLDPETNVIFLTSGSYLQGVDTELRLNFDGFLEEEGVSGTNLVAYYSGYFRFVSDEGKTYIARFMEVPCATGQFANYLNGMDSSFITLVDEDPEYFGQGIEEVVAATPNGKKVLFNNQLLIIRDGKAFNVLGNIVK